MVDDASTGVPAERLDAVTEAIVQSMSSHWENEPEAEFSLLSEAESVSTEAEEKAVLSAVLAKPEVQEAINGVFTTCSRMHARALAAFSLNHGSPRGRPVGSQDAGCRRPPHPGHP
jgi:hypothetical protein